MPAITDGVKAGVVPKAPGMKYKHYAPDADLKIIEGDIDKVVSYINDNTRKLMDEGCSLSLSISSLSAICATRPTLVILLESLLDELKDSKRTICYRSVLISENEKKRLLEDVMENPYDLFYYGKYLVKEYPEQVYELCYKEISESCAQAKDRREYKKITKNIAQLIKWKGKDTAKFVIKELKQTYPRRPALLDELEKVEKKL